MKKQRKNIAVFASHGGSNLQAVINAIKSGVLNTRVAVVISNNSGAFALERARREGIPSYHISERVCRNADETIHKVLCEHQADIVFLAGYLKKIGASVLKVYEGSIYNIHPSLLPKFGGKGMHGLNVHEAVLKSGDAVTGVTIHRVTAEYDDGDIISQRVVPVLPGDTPQTLAARVLEAEHILIVETLRAIT